MIRLQVLFFLDRSLGVNLFLCLAIGCVMPCKLIYVLPECLTTVCRVDQLTDFPYHVELEISWQEVAM